MKRSDLPFGSEFSPSQIRLSHVLELARKYGGDWKAFEAAIRQAYFESHRTSDYNKGKLANNTKLGMIAYDIIDRDANLTDLGRKLYEIREDEERLYKELSRHILLNLHGITLVQCVQDIQASGETPSLIKLREWLEERGIYFPRGGKHPSIMRLWLEKAGIFTSGWRINEEKLAEILGTSTTEIEVLSKFSPEQKAYLKTLANIGQPGRHLSNDIEKLATSTYGIKFDEKNLPKQVLYPLAEANYITLERGTKQAGRGAKPFIVLPTKKLAADLIVPILNQLDQQVQSDLRPFLRKPLSQIVRELRARDKYMRGLALEAMAIRLMRLIDLDYVVTRLKGKQTGGAEVDVIFESSRLVYSRWQVQCKNTKVVTLDDIAKEVGITHFLKSNVIVVLTTGRVGSEARKYTNKIMTDSNLCIVIGDGDDIAGIIKNPPAIANIFNREAKNAMKLKTLII
ncbi:MAG: restriction endonuclease [Candidatus Aminicenantales bacterium]